MSGQTRRLWEAGKTSHPDDSVLLAFIRQQAFAASLPSLQQHIFACNRCQQRYIDLTDISALLSDTLGHSNDSQAYPSLVPAVLEIIQDPGPARPARQKHRLAGLRETLALDNVKAAFGQPQAQRSSANRLGAMPTAVALLLLAAAVVLTFTVTASAFGLFHVAGETIPLPLQPTPPSPSHAVTSLVNQPSATPAAEPAGLTLCTTSLDRVQSRVHICGAHFTPGDKVRLVVETAPALVHTRHTLLVDAKGNFQDSWIVVACRYYPTAVFVEDLTHPLAVTTGLQNDQLGRCSLRRPTPAAGP